MPLKKARHSKTPDALTKALTVIQTVCSILRSTRLVAHMHSFSSRYTPILLTRASSLSTAKSRMKSLGSSSISSEISTTSCLCYLKSSMGRDSKRYAWIRLIKYVSSIISTEKKSKIAMQMTKDTRSKISTSICRSWWWWSSGLTISCTSQRCRLESFRALSSIRRLNFR